MAMYNDTKPYNIRPDDFMIHYDEVKISILKTFFIYHDILNDSEWEKTLFVREPSLRLSSEYLDK